MESFVTWASEKRELNEVGAVAGLGAAAAVGVVTYWFTKGQNKRDEKKNVLVHRKSGDEGDRERAFDGSTVVKMYDAREIDENDWFTPPGAQNWMKIGDAIKQRKFLPWSESIRVGKKTLRAGDSTKWKAVIDGEFKVFPTSKEFAAAIANGEIEKGNYVWHSGYDNWKRYGDKDVDDDIASYVAKEKPSIGDTSLLDSPTKYILRGQPTPIKFEDLGKLRLADDAYVWVKKYKNEWVRFKEIKKKLPHLGQAHVSRPRGWLSRMARRIGGQRIVHNEPTKDGWENGKKEDPAPTPPMF